MQTFLLSANKSIVFVYTAPPAVFISLFPFKESELFAFKKEADDSISYHLFSQSFTKVLDNQPTIMNNSRRAYNKRNTEIYK